MFQRHRRSPPKNHVLSFLDDVEVVCTRVPKHICMISHCQHGFVQQTLHHLQHAITSVCAPLSTHEAREAVLSSEVNDLDSSSLMQTIPGHLPRPIQRNAPKENQIGIHSNLLMVIRMVRNLTMLRTRKHLAKIPMTLEIMTTHHRMTQ